MVADPGALALREAERVLQLGAAGEQRHAACRRAAAGSPARIRASGAANAVARAPGERDDPHDRVVGARLDRAVVEQEQIGESRRAARARPRRGRRSARRRRSPLVITSVVPASCEQQVMQRRVGQHHAELARSRARPRPRPARRGRRGASTIGRSGAASSSRSRSPSVTSDPAAASEADHQRERLVLAMLARAQRGDRALVVGAAGEMEPADALDGDDRAVAQRPRRRLRPDRRAAPAASAWPAPSSSATDGSALRARVRLGVEAPVARDPRTPPGSARTSRTPAIVVSGRS